MSCFCVAISFLEASSSSYKVSGSGRAPGLVALRFKWREWETLPNTSWLWFCSGELLRFFNILHGIQRRRRWAKSFYRSCFRRSPELKYLLINCSKTSYPLEDLGRGEANDCCRYGDAGRDIIFKNIWWMKGCLTIESIISCFSYSKFLQTFLSKLWQLFLAKFILLRNVHVR